jgi:hypothetical protein
MSLVECNSMFFHHGLVHFGGSASRASSLGLQLAPRSPPLTYAHSAFCASTLSPLMRVARRVTRSTCVFQSLMAASPAPTRPRLRDYPSPAVLMTLVLRPFAGALKTFADGSAGPPPIRAWNREKPWPKPDNHRGTASADGGSIDRVGRQISPHPARAVHSLDAS